MSKTITIQDSRLVTSKISGWWDSAEIESWKPTLFILIDGEILEFEFNDVEELEQSRYDLQMALSEK